MFERLGAEWSSYTTIPSEFVTEGDAVVATGEYCGTYKATGKSFRAPFAHVWKVRNGKIVNFFQFTDTAVVQKALQ